MLFMFLIVGDMSFVFGKIIFKVIIVFLVVNILFWEIFLYYYKNNFEKIE